MFKKLTRFFNKSTRWSKTLICLGFLLLVLMTINQNTQIKEGFSQRRKYVLRKNDKIFDDFYVPVYDQLMNNKVKNLFEVKEIARTTKFNKHSVLLDIGSGLGHHVNLFNKLGAEKCIGLDKSPAMIRASQYKYNDSQFKTGDVMNFMNFEAQSFTHITCLYFTIYYIKDKTRFFKNCYEWLLPRGYMALHLVNRNKFDPILNSADPLQVVSAQKYAKKRITNSLIKFKDFQYRGDFKLDKDIATFEEIFKDDKTKHIRQNIHKMYMPTQRYILSIAKELGFILKGKIDLVPVQYEYQYLYVLYKPE